MSIKSPIALSIFAALISTSAMANGHCQPGSNSCYRLVTSPAEYGTVSEQVVVRQARTVARHIPAEYGVVQEQVMVRPARTVAHHIPAVINTVSERVLISPARRTWQVSRDAYGQTVGCWVDVPAQYGVQQRQVVVQPAGVRHETIPGEYATRSRQVMTRPGNVVHETIPAVYSTQHRQVLVRPASQGWQPAGYR